MWLTSDNRAYPAYPFGNLPECQRDSSSDNKIEEVEQ